MYEGRKIPKIGIVRLVRSGEFLFIANKVRINTMRANEEGL